jgi:hypothetical protein
MNRRANTVFLHNDFTQWPWLQSQLDLPLQRQFQMAPGGGGGGWADQKIGNNVFHTRQIQHLHIEFGNESQMALL